MRLSVLALLCFTCLNVNAQADSTAVDSVSEESTYRLLPGMPASHQQSSSHAMIKVDLLPFNNGVSLLNNLRGNVPNMTLDPYYQVDTLTWRFSKPLLIIDGIPFNKNISNNYNLNTFEYGKMDVLQSRNAAIAYGGTGTNGAILIQSKTGEGLAEPQFEVNSYTTNSWNDWMDRWQLSNAVAYAQDFGNVDTRVSINYSKQLGPINTRDEDLVNLRINTGLNLGRFSARVLLNGNSNSIGGFENSKAVSTQANLTAQYKFQDWLSMSAQFNRMNVTHDPTEYFNQTRNRYHQYDVGNLLVHLMSNQRKPLTITGTLGYLFNSFERSHSTTYSDGSSGSDFATGTGGAFFFNTGIELQKNLHVGATLRLDHITPQSYETVNWVSYSFFGSYVFTKLIDRSGKALSFAKLRTSFGHNDNRFDNSIPTPMDRWMSYPSGLPSSTFEAGIDLAFIKDKIKFTFNYFDNVLYNTPITYINSDTGYPATYLGGTDLSIQGIEAIALFRVLSTRLTRIETQLVYGKDNQKFKTATSGPGLGSPLADWTGSWLNRISWNKFSFSFLIDISNGGFLYGSTPGSGNMLYDRSFSKLRECSLGYFLPNVGWKKAYVSIIGRNLLLISGPPFEPEIFLGFPEFQKSVSLNIDFTF